MSYIGNSIVSTDFPVDYFSGNNSTTAFTLSIAPASVNALDVQVGGVPQSPQTYTVSGTTLTFSTAPPTGSSNIIVRHKGIAGIPNVPSAASVTTSSLASGFVLPAANAPSGSVIQVVSTTKTDTFTSAANSTWTDITGMSVTLTPKFSTSKILVTISMFGVFWQQGFNGAILNLLRNGTAIGGGNSSGSRSSVIGTQWAGTPASDLDSGVQYHFSFIDSPATTSSTTYKLQFYQDSPGYPIYVNRGRVDSDTAVYPRTSSSIIVTEILA